MGNERSLFSFVTGKFFTGRDARQLQKRREISLFDNATSCQMAGKVPLSFISS